MNMVSTRGIVGSLVVLSLVWIGETGRSEEPVSNQQVTAAMRKAATFYRTKIAVQGGYVYHTSADLTQRWGEGIATADQIWVQPPGTPTVGMAYLNAYSATGDRYYLDAAIEAGDAFVYGQLSSGGWRNSIDLQGRKLGYRFSGGKKRKEGFSSLDDGQTQSAIEFMVRLDEALEFKNEEIHQSAMFALDSLLAAQFANGGFPQGWKAPASKQPVLKASYPDYDWRTEGRIKNYWDMFTLNDNVCGYVADTLIVADDVYQDDRYQVALKKLGDFLILAQMPDPQPAWSQQYNYDMKPIWARKFEPAAIAGDESQEAIETLTKIAIATGDLKYLEPIPRALAYLKKSQLADGQIARYYELKSNKPLYMKRVNSKVYELTYDDSNLPAHYAWTTSSKVDRLEQRYRQLKAGRFPAGNAGKVSASKIRTIINELDDQGRWVSTHQGERLVGQPKFQIGAKYLSSDRFSRNLSALSHYLAQANNKQ